MGQYADDALSGLVCQQCGVFIDGEEVGYERLCKECERDNKKTQKNPKKNSIFRGKRKDG